MKGIGLFLLLFVCCACAYGREYHISGSVRDASSGEAIPFCTVSFPGTMTGTTTDVNGRFSLSVSPDLAGRFLHAGCVGFLNDSILFTPDKTSFHFLLSSSAKLLNEVVISGTMTESSKLESAVPVEVYHPAFFKKNPSPGIFESLSMVNGVQPQLNCNVCNTGDIHINGMEGPYTMVLIDGMPIVSSLSTVYGLAGIPNSMVKRIEIVKGPASALYGSEAVGGLVNIITKDAATSPRVKSDLMGSSYGEFNLDVASKTKLRNASSLWGANLFYYNTVHDINEDGFTDIALQKRFSLFNKWTYNAAPDKPASLGLRYVYEDRWGGETNWTPAWRGTDSIYGESIYVNRLELIGTNVLSTGKKLRLEYSYNYHHQNSFYGTTSYIAGQHTGFTQLLWDHAIGRHSLLAGLPFRYIQYQDNTQAMNNTRQQTILPGIFVQDEWKTSSKTTLLGGMRFDYHNEHGSIFTPRLSAKFNPSGFHTFRISAGTGYRVVNLFTEDHAALTGARSIVIAEELKPERSWNVNANYFTQFDLRRGFIVLDASLFYTRFSNKITGDFITDPDLIIYDNLNGYAVSKGASLSIDWTTGDGTKINAGMTVMNVYQTENDSTGVPKKTPQLFAPHFSSTFGISKSIRKIGLTFDLTGLIKSPMYLPVLPNDFRPEKSPWFCLMNIQCTKYIGDRLEVYGGLKNLLNFVPNDPIMRPFDPFDKEVSVDNPNGYTFDPSYNYAPVQGIRGFAGIRFAFN